MARVILDRDRAKVGDLPAVCVYSGRPATTTRRMTFTSTFPFHIVAGRGFITARLPVSDAYLNYSLFWKLAIVPLITLAAIALFALNQIGSVPKPGPWSAYRAWQASLTLTMLGFFMLAIIVYIVWFYCDIRLRSVSWTELQLAGVHEAFAEACAETVPPPLPQRIESERPPPLPRSRG